MLGRTCQIESEESGGSSAFDVYERRLCSLHYRICKLICNGNCALLGPTIIISEKSNVRNQWIKPNQIKFRQSCTVCKSNQKSAFVRGDFKFWKISWTATFPNCHFFLQYEFHSRNEITGLICPESSLNIDSTVIFLHFPSSLFISTCSYIEYLHLAKHVLINWLIEKEGRNQSF